MDSKRFNLKDNEDFYGSVPLVMDASKNFEIKVGNLKLLGSGTDYTGEGYYSWYPLLTIWKGRVLPTSEDTIKVDDLNLAEEIIQSFERGDWSGEPRAPIAFDTDHEEKLCPGWAVKFGIYKGQIKTIKADGTIFVNPEIPKDAVTIMCQVGWTEYGVNLIKSGQRPYVSISYMLFSDGSVFLRPPSLLLSRADKTLPRVFIAGQRKEKMGKFDMRKMLGIKAAESDLDAQCVTALQTALAKMTEEQKQAFIDQMTSMTEAEPETPPEAPKAEAAPAWATNLANKIDGLTTTLKAGQKPPEKPAEKPAEKPVLDAGIKAATRFLNKQGYPDDVIKVKAEQFKGFDPKEVEEDLAEWSKHYPVDSIGKVESSGVLGKPPPKEDKQTDIYAAAAKLKTEKGISFNEALKIVKAKEVK